jgi:uncharacterized protein YabE (DUF348 family)
VVHASRVRRLRIRRAARAFSVSILVASSAGLAWVVTGKTVTLVIGGRSASIETTSGSVGELLHTHGLSGAPGVSVAPPPSTSLADGMTVVVSPAPGSSIRWAPTTDPTDVGVWVMERTGGEPLARAARPSGGTAGSAPHVGPSPAVSARVVVSGKVHDVLSNAGTAGELLSAMGIRTDADDRVAPSPSTPLQAGLTVRVDRVETLTRVIRRAVPFDTAVTYTSRLMPGERDVVRRGEPGIEVAAERVVTINGVVATRQLVASWIVRQPVDRRVLSGPASSSGGTIVGPGGARTEAGIATWYDPPWAGYSAAHPWLPFGTRVTVTDPATGRSVIVVINDRGPFSPGRIIDLSPEAFARLAPLGRGILEVRIAW